MSTIICPHCKNTIDDDDALMCHFCGESLNRTSNSVLGMMRGAGMKWIWVMIAAVVAVVMIIMMF